MNKRHGLMLSGLLAIGAAQGQTCRTDISESTSADRFQIRNGGATALDTKTGLEWKRCPEGYGFSDNATSSEYGDESCTDGGPSTFNWRQAQQKAQAADTPRGQTSPNGLPEEGGFAGASDWRVPNIKELDSIAERACFDPGINLRVFPGTPSELFWSASPYANYTDVAWLVSFDIGFDGTNVKAYPSRVRLVRGGQ